MKRRTRPVVFASTRDAIDQTRKSDAPSEEDIPDQAVNGAGNMSVGETDTALAMRHGRLDIEWQGGEKEVGGHKWTSEWLPEFVLAQEERSERKTHLAATGAGKAGQHHKR